MASQAPNSPPQPAAGERRLIVRNFVSLSAASIAGRVVGLFTGIYTRRILGVIAIGQLSWCSSVLSYFSMLINPGVETIARRDVAREPGLSSRYVSRLLTLQLVLALVAFLLVGLFAMLGLRGPQISLILALQAVNLLLIPLNLTWLLQAHERMAPAALTEVVSQLLLLPAVALFIHSPAHVVRYVLLAYPLRIGAIIFLAWYASRRRLFRWEEIRPTPHGSLALVKEAVPLGLTQVAVLLYYNFDAILLGFIWGDAVVGLYSTAYSLMMAPLTLAASLTTAYFPALSRAQGNADQMKQTSAELLRVIVWMGFPISAMGWAAGRYVVHLMYGEHFAASGPLFEWLSLDIAFVFFNVGIGWPLIAWGHQKENFYATVVGAALNVGLNCALIPPFGVWPAVATTILAEVAVMVYLLYWRRRICPISVLRIAWKPLVASIIVGVATKVLVSIFSSYWWIVVGCGVVGLMASVWVAEKETIRRLVGRSLISQKIP
jgi:O-antigen/teichoic acid export membrane protein